MVKRNIIEATSMYGFPVTIELKVITPECAKEILSKSEGARSLRKKYLEKYERSMRDKSWKWCDSMILIDYLGHVDNGNHRLVSVVKSGVPQEFVVVCGVPPDTKYHTDDGSKRSLADDFKSGFLCKEKHALIAGIVQRMYNPRGNYSASRATLVDFYTKTHQEAAVFAAKSFRKNLNRVTTTPVGAAIASAWYYVDDKSLLVRFAEVLVDGIADGKHESAAIYLRDWLKDPNTKSRGGGPGGADAYLKATIAIRSFVRGQDLHKWPGLKSWYNLFPLPETDPKTGIANGLTCKRVDWYRQTFGS
jgi:hypothetical protein